MTNDDSSATKGDLKREIHGLRDELRKDMKQMELRMDTKLETATDEVLSQMHDMKDQIIRAFHMTEGDIRKEDRSQR